MYKAHVYVVLKPGVLDPKGDAVKKSLHVMGYKGVNEVRIGKFIEVWLEAESREEALRKVEKMSAELLANPVIEDYRVEIVGGE
ncbi:phosphoribosylformylglycinamidine synthase [Thermosyntropha lipolytica DSM 11003]|uniref:Phosphoribosylformylglycinamidine synthase subunit PurS n=1 Tax=Thermosyntropha lipolytica DSM 11003 TaxID=1123382 RepID=A0A1M5JAP2_9FIRM|nr:phosphoribosylformylglycinamidine synthase subunit PurS [Thermosyntropha lipolytica]SHG37455.1 phosphoribosylformylglycinamidine synthase [Thermosyntropha lipolytica DSM 11003]